MKTPKLKILALCLLMAPFAIKAQLGSHLGITFGPSVSHFYGSNAARDLRPLGGFSGGLVYHYAFTPTFALQTGVLWDNKGATSGTINYPGDVKVNYRYNYNYVTMPLLFRVHLLPNSTVRPFFNVGPYFSVLANQNTLTVVNTRGDLDFERDNNTRDFTPVDVGMSGAFGLDFLLNNNTHLDIEVRDNVGLVNVNAPGNPNPRMYNNNVAFLVSLFFSIPQALEE